MAAHLAIIPARRGSTGVPLKNMADLGGKPLVGHTIDCAKASEVFDDIAVTSDWPELLKYAKDQGCIPIERPDTISGGDSPVTEALIHAVQVLKRAGKEYKTVTMLNPTSPFRQPRDIIGLHQVKKDHPCPAAMTVVGFRPLVMGRRRRGPLRWWHLCGDAIYNRQRRSPVYRQNGAVYIVDTEYLLETGKLYGEKCAIMEMPPERSLDIDTPWDLIAARAYHAEFKRIAEQKIDLGLPEPAPKSEITNPVPADAQP